MIITSSKNGEIVIIMNKTESCSMMHRHKKIIYGILIICMVFFGIFGSGNLLRDGERTSSEPGDTEDPDDESGRKGRTDVLCKK